MNSTERGHEIYRLRQEVLSLREQVDAVTGDPQKAFISLYQENILLKERLEIAEKTKNLKNLKWTSEDWNAYARLRGEPGEQYESFFSFFLVSEQSNEQTNKKHRMTQAMKLKLKPSVAAELGRMERQGETHGVVLQRIFDDLARMEETFRVMMLDLRNRIFDPTLLPLAVKAKAKEMFRSPMAWVRICAYGVTQLEVDHMRQFFPGVIPGHSTFNTAKVGDLMFIVKSCSHWILE